MNTNVIQYDNTCAFCRKWAGRGQAWLGARGFRFEPMIDGGTAGEMRVVAADGRTFGGADAIIYLCSQLWWAWPVWMASRLPGMMTLLRRFYAWFAPRRHCLNGACEMGVARNWIGWLPSVVMLSAGMMVRGRLEPWLHMWVMVVAIFGGFKWLTWWRGRGEPAGKGRTLAYLLLWPGMDWKAFAHNSGRDGARRSRMIVAVKIVFGAVMFWGVARMVPETSPLVRGWVGWIGLAFLLHFGAMHALALVWGVKPIMDAPLLAKSVNEFWSRRWNTAFPQLAGPLWFEPMKKWFSPATAIMGVFLISGLLHELVISLPAGAGYGMPTAYFAVQGVGILLERKAARWASAPYRRMWAWLVVAGPAVILFHPVFVHNVVLPMMKDWRAL